MPQDAPLLCSEPTQASQRFRFPFLVVEAKAYATAGSVALFDAQNQAAVAGACSLKILHDLDDLVRKCNGSTEGRPIVFSVCTEGAILQLWVHYTSGDDDRTYHMAQVDTCDAGLLKHVPGFLEAVDNVIGWGSSKHKKTITEKLRIVLKPSSVTQGSQ
ncbi:hypothetical protein V8E54_002815 [Elaphomyces granulatus]